MPLYNPNDTVIPTEDPVEPVPVIETASVYQNTNERVNITPHIEGNTWTVIYYGRVIGDMDPATLDTDISDPSLIQYQEVKNMEIRVTQDLTQTTDPQTQTTTVVGRANMYPIVIPVIGDVFLGELGDGTWGKFSITSMERQSIFKESAWEIEYALSEYVSQPVLDALAEKVVQTLFFDLKGLNKPGGALATESEYKREVTRAEMIDDMINRFYEEYYRDTLRTFLVPDSIYKIYDPYLVEFWNYVISKDQINGRMMPHQFDVRSAIFKTDYVTVWDAVIRQNRKVLERAVHSMRELSTSMFQLPYIAHTMHSTGFDKIIHPHAVNGLAIPGGTDAQVDPLEPYIFTTEFYTNTDPGQSDFELEMQKMINGTVLAFSDIEPFYQELDTMEPKDRFYRIPFLIAMMNVSR